MHFYLLYLNFDSLIFAILLILKNLNLFSSLFVIFRTYFITSLSSILFSICLFLSPLFCFYLVLSKKKDVKDRVLYDVLEIEPEASQGKFLPSPFIPLLLPHSLLSSLSSHLHPLFSSPVPPFLSLIPLFSSPLSFSYILLSHFFESL